MKYIAGSLAWGFTIVVSLILNNVLNAEKNKKSNMLASAAVCMLLSFVSGIFYTFETFLYDTMAMLVYTLVYLFGIIIANGCFKLRYLYIVFLYEFTVNIIVSCLANLINPLLEIQYHPLYVVILTVINIILMLVICSRRQKIYSSAHFIADVLPKYLYALILFAVFSLCGLTTLNNYPTDYIEKKQGIMNFIFIILTFIFICIISSLLVNVILKQRFSSTSEMLKNQVEIQLRHYDKLEKLNNEMQSFRHDYINHLRSLQLLIQMNDNNGAAAYIENLLDEKRSTRTMFYTGNRLADAILTDKSDSLPDGFNIEYQGKIPQTLDNVHLCVILTNALDNAIEACGHLSSAGTISITAQEKQGYFVMTVTNPAAENLNFSDIPSTTKSDAEKHGMGLTNIRKVVEEYDGQMRVNCENSIFELSITLKL